MITALLVTPYGYQNQGIRLLAAMLERAEHAAPVLYLKGWRNNDIQLPSDKELALFDAYLAEREPDLVGIGFGTPYIGLVRQLCQRIRAAAPTAHIVLGGVHPTIMPEDCIDHADSVCIGEGEEPLVDLASAIEAGQPVEGIPNLWIHRKKGGGAGEVEVEKNPPRPLITDLDALPWNRLGKLDTAFIDDDKLTRGDPQEDNTLYRIFASRGCPYGCAFCYNSQYREIYKGLGRYHRTRTIPSVMAELEQALRDRPGLRKVRFDDDTFVFPRAWLDEFAREYPARVGLPFDILLNPLAANARTLKLLSDAGLVHVQVGVQGASEEEVEKQYARKGSNARLLELAHQLHDLGVAVTYDIIQDNPLETRAEKQAMLDLLLSLPRPFNLFIYSLVIFPRSQTARTLLDAGIITEDQVEGRATKSFEQFRLTLDYPRPAEDTFYACLISLASKGFIPRSLLRALSRNEALRANPTPLRLVAEAANFVKLGQVALDMLVHGELSRFKLKEYASFKRRLIQ